MPPRRFLHLTDGLHVGWVGSTAGGASMPPLSPLYVQQSVLWNVEINVRQSLLWDAPLSVMAHWFDTAQTFAQNINGSVLVDNTTNGNDAGLVGSYCGDFNGSNRQVVLPEILSAAGAFKLSVTCVIDDFSKPGPYSDFRRIVRDFMLISTSELRIDTSGSNRTLLYLSTPLVAGQAYKIVLERDASNQYSLTVYDATDNSVHATASLASAPGSLSIDRIGAHSATSGIFDGQIFDVEFSVGGTLWAHYVFSSGSEQSVYDVSGNGRHATGSNLAWTTQNVYHHNLTYGCRNSGGVLIPGLLDGSAAADGNPLTAPAGNGLNDCETKIDMSVIGGPSAWAYGDALPANVTADISGGLYQNFRYTP